MSVIWGVIEPAERFAASPILKKPYGSVPPTWGYHRKGGEMGFTVWKGVLKWFLNELKEIRAFHECTPLLRLMVFGRKSVQTKNKKKLPSTISKSIQICPKKQDSTLEGPFFCAKNKTKKNILRKINSMKGFLIIHVFYIKRPTNVELQKYKVTN